MIRARSAEIDNSDRLAHRISPFAEPESRVHHERGPDHEHGISVFERRQRIIDTLSGYALPEKHDIRFQDTRTARAVGDLKRIEIAFDIGISVGSRRRSRGLKFRIERFERSLDP